MPPWLVRDDGTCGTFQDSPALTEDEVATIEAWVDGGSLAGTPRDDLKVPELDHLADGVGRPRGNSVQVRPGLMPE